MGIELIAADEFRICGVSFTKLKSVTYVMPPEMDFERLRAELSPHFRLLAVAGRPHRVADFDTFDWRLHRAGGRLRLAPATRGVLPTRGSVLSWSRVHGAASDVSWATRTVPSLIRDFPAGPLRETLAPIVQMRCLQPVVELEVSSWQVRILDRRDKTVVRLQFEQSVAVEPGSSAEPVPLPPLLRLRPVRGYAKAWKRLVQYLESELDLVELAGSELDLALAAIGRHPGDYTSKVVIDLDPEMPAGEATQHIHRELLAAMRRNELGTRKDLDSEFLHDFRVAVRRSRSALTQIKNVYPAAAIARFKPELAWLGGITGPTRDLDVYLLKMEDYSDQLSAAARPHFEPLIDHLRSEQRRAQRRMARAMNSRRYRDLLAAWEHFLTVPLDLGPSDPGTSDLETPANAARPIAELASERIWKVYRRVIKRGGMINDDTPADPVHELRIECKKLRYLMEFFRGFYDAPAINQLIKSLKQLQDNLGNFNDCEVQRGGLIGFAEAMQRQGKAPVFTLMAIGRLADDLEAGQLHERRVFGQKFARFSTPENQHLAKQLFGPS